MPTRILRTSSLSLLDLGSAGLEEAGGVAAAGVEEAASEDWAVGDGAAEDVAGEDWEDGCGAAPVCATLPRRAPTSSSKTESQAKNVLLKKMLRVTVPLI